MRVLLRIIGVGVLAVVALVAVAVWDMGWNGGSWIARFAGRDALVQACTPPLERELARRGFSPVEIVFEEVSSLSMVSGSFGHRRRLESAFTFTDGQQGPRIDGQMVCTAEGSAISVLVEVDSLPRRVT